MNFKNSLLTFAVLGQMTLTSCASTAQNMPLKVLTHTAGEAGFMVNSHLIMGQKEALLVDAQFTRSEADKVVQMIRQSGKKLTQIYITHAHPDHYLGLEKIKEAFPEARILAAKAVVDLIQESAQGKLNYWKGIYKDDLADDFILPEVHEENFLQVEDKKVSIINLGVGESSHDTALFIDESKTLLSGDALYSGVHLWLAENHPQEVLKNIGKLAGLKAQTVLPGHGVSGGAALIEENQRYVQDFLKITAQAGSEVEAKEQMLAKYGTYKLPIILDLALQARMKK